MLQELLNLGLLEIGDDDTRFEKMEETAKELGEKLKATPSLLIPAASIMLDGEFKGDDSVYDLTEKIVVKNWKTLRNTHVNRPYTLLRSIIVSAVSLAAKSSPEAASLVWNTSLGRVNHRQTNFGKEINLVTGLLEELASIAEKEAVTRAGMSAPKKRRSKKKTEAIVFVAPAKTEILDNEVIGNVARAAGPQYPSGTTLTDANPNWSNTAGNWSWEFIPRMANAMTEAVNLSSSKNMDALSKAVAEFADALSQKVTKTVQAIEEEATKKLEAASSGEAMRMNVLWWAKSKYSTSMNCSYRDLPRAVGALVMAHDISKLTPALAPASVAYVLGESVGSVYCQSETTTVESFVSEVREKASDFTFVPDIPKAAQLCRLTLGQIVLGNINGSFNDISELKAQTGISPSLELNAPEFSMWMFREMQTQKLLEALRQ